MAVGVAANIPDFSGTYIPHLFSSKLLVEFYQQTVFGDIANTDYEGEIRSAGDKVTIRMLPTATTAAYTKGMELVYQTPEPDTIDLLIDKARYWAFSANALDVKMSDIEFVNRWAEHYSKQLMCDVDSDVLADVYSQADSTMQGIAAGDDANIDLGAAGDAVQLSDSTILDKIIDLGVLLDQKKAPDEGRWLVLPAWACGLIKKSDLQNVSITGDSKSPLRNGLIGEIDRFKIYKSNQLHKVTADSATCCIFGHKSALTFASAFTDKETIDNPKDFGKLMRMCMAYGYKVVKPTVFGLLYAKQ